MAGEWRTFGSINKCTSFDRVHVDMASAEHEAPRYKCPLWGRAESNSIRHVNDWFRRTAEARDLANKLPLTATEQSFPRMPSDGKVYPFAVIAQ